MRRLLSSCLLALLLLAPALAWAQPHSVSGSITTNGQVVQFAPINGGSGVIQVAGAWTGTLQFECTVDGTNFFSVNGALVVGAGSVTSTTANGQWFFPASACAVMRVRASAAITGTATVALLSKTAAGAIVQSDGTFVTLTAGTVANDTAITQNPLLVSLETVAIGTQPAAATAGNQRRMTGNREGALFTQYGGANQFSCFVEAVTVLTECRAAPAAGLRAYITSFNLVNEAATAQTLDVIFGTGANCATGPTALTPKFSFVAAAAVVNYGAALPTPLVPTAANAICVRPSAATAFGAVLTGYIAP